MTYRYIASGTLEEGTPTYVSRKADNELYEELKAGQFCYVFDASKAGKSSLQVQVKSRLEKAGFVCITIDLQGKSSESRYSEQWYDGILKDIVKDLKLKVNVSSWTKEHNWLSPLERFREFIESVLLAQISENIVIFFDEINCVLSLKFPTDDFFAFIRFCYNQRVYNPNYKRLVFCLLGIASPSNLIKDQQRTPFNISKAISLEPFQSGEEVEPLSRGLEGKFSNPQAVMQEILNWTGGQPFLTQKLCKFMVDESEKDNPLSVEEVVKAEIIKDWKNNDNPAHLQTISKRILTDERKASYLLELYQRILQGEVKSNDSSEVKDLVLSGLVVIKEKKLIVYNRIYSEIFNLKWIEIQLNNLRPYSDNFRVWLDSRGTDESRLLRGKALKEAEEWANNRDLSFQDKQYLAASKEKEIQEEIAASALEREQKDREAAEKRNQVLAEANQEATRLMENINKYLETVEELVTLAKQIREQGSFDEADDLSVLAGETVSIKDQSFKEAILYAGISYAYQKLKDSKELPKSKRFQLADIYLNKIQVKADKHLESVQIQTLILRTKGNLFKEKGNKKEAITFYTNAFNLLKSNYINPFDKNMKSKIISIKNQRNIFRQLIALLSDSSDSNDVKLTKQVEEFLKKSYLDELDYFLKQENWELADQITYDFMFVITKTELESKFALELESIMNLPCAELRKIDNLWVKYSNGRFGFSVQQNIFLETGNELNKYNESAYQRFGSRIGWYDKKRDQQTNGNGWLNRGQLNYSIDAPEGHLPGNGSSWLWSGRYGLYVAWAFSSRTAACMPPPVVSPKRKGKFKLPLLDDTASSADIQLSGKWFLFLSFLSVFYEAPKEQILYLTLPAGIGLSIYFLNRKEGRLVRAVLLSVLGLISGLMLGGLLGSWLLPQINIISLTAEQFSTVLTLFLLWLVSSFLR